MKELFVPYELALKLKERGFDEPCLAFYNEKHLLLSFGEKLNVFWNSNKKIHYNRSIYNLFNESKCKKTMCNAPLYQQVIDWFREKHDILIFVSAYKKDKYIYQLYSYDDKELSDISEWIFTYYEALTKAIEEALKLI